MTMTEPSSHKAANQHGQVDEASPPAPPDEMELVASAQKGNLEAYDELVRRYQERIYATVYHMTPITKTPTIWPRKPSSRPFTPFARSREVRAFIPGSIVSPSTRPSIFSNSARTRRR